MVAVTVFVAVSISDTDPDPLAAKLTTQTNAPSGWTATPHGLIPTGMVAITVLAGVSITETVFDA
jgi:hypothetical protein